jgi:hypothetical protein
MVVGVFKWSIEGQILDSIAKRTLAKTIHDTGSFSPAAEERRQQILQTFDRSKGGFVLRGVLSKQEVDEPSVLRGPSTKIK